MRKVKDFYLSLILFLITAVLAEVTIRIFVHSTPAGENSLGPIILKPFRLPIESTQTALLRYANNPNGRIKYDPDLGWTARPLGVSEDKLYRYNASGIRDELEYSQQPSPQKHRIEIFGDSITHCDEVVLAHSWGKLLEKKLHERGIDAEVLNFGLSAYSIDQAYLRWEKEGKAFKPNIVILGFQAENVKRNLNLLRPLYVHTGADIPFFKPRFIIESEKLKLINTPTPAPDDVIPIMENFAAYPLSRWEYFYTASDFQERFWRKSFLLATVSSALFESNKYAFQARERAIYDPSGEGTKITLAILDQFKRSVIETGAEFRIVHLPFSYHLQQKARDGNYPYESLLLEIENRFGLIAPASQLIEAAQASSFRRIYTSYGYHFSKDGNEIISNVIRDAITKTS